VPRDREPLSGDTCGELWADGAGCPRCATAAIADHVVVMVVSAGAHGIQGAALPGTYALQEAGLFHRRDGAINSRDASHPRRVRAHLLGQVIDGEGARHVRNDPRDLAPALRHPPHTVCCAFDGSLLTDNDSQLQESIPANTGIYRLRCTLMQVGYYGVDNPAIFREGLDVNVSQLRTFVAVVESGSFSAAARVMGVSQPAVTMQIQALEADVGATLLDRRYRKVELTEAGRTLLPHARDVISTLQEARVEIESLSGSVTGRLVIAASTTPGVYIIPRLLGAFLADNPEVGVTVTVHDTEEVMDAVESGEAHIGITGATARRPRIDFEQRGVDELVCIAHPAHRLAMKDGVSLAELAEERWILREPGSGTRQVSERALSDAGLNPDDLVVAVELGSGEAIVSAVEGGLGISILSRLVAEKALHIGAVTALKIGCLPAQRPFYIVTPKGTPTRAAAAFHEHLSTGLDALSSALACDL
jgi:DNA-binding transcriptional LysR family regulator